MDLVEITTRYLKNTDSRPDMREIGSFGSSGTGSLFAQLFWFIITLLGIGFLGLTAYEYQEYRAMLRDHVDAVAVAHRLNAYTLPHFYAHCGVSLCLLLSMSWIAFAINAPLLIVRLVLHKYGALMLSSAQIARFSARGSGILGMSPDSRYFLALGTYGIAALVYCYQLFGN